MKDSFNFNEMTFEEDGYFMQLTSFTFNFTKTEAEILNETVNKYRYRRWQ